MICLIIFLSSVLLVLMCAQQKVTARSPLLIIFFFNYNKIDEFKLFLSEKLENINNEHNPDAIADGIIEVPI